MPINFPVYEVALLNVGGWLAIQLGLAWLFLRLPARWFDWPNQAPAAGSRRLYERVLRVKSWKDHLPDAASWFDGGFAKRKLGGRNPDYLRRFILETRRGEICHWLVIASAPVFLIWNPWWGFIVNLSYALLANLPCILAQRYNRSRLLRLCLTRK